MGNCESSSNEGQNIIPQLDEQQNIFCANRDGDLYYIECPECHSTDLKRPHMFMCRDCGTFFYLYTEDGIKNYWWVRVNHTIRNQDKEIIIMTDERGRHYSPFERQQEQLKKELGDSLKRTEIIYRDLRENGKDAHRHQKYQKFLVIKTS